MSHPASINLYRPRILNIFPLPQSVPLGVATHGCALFRLHLPKVREYAGERILIPDGKPKRAPRRRKVVLKIVRRRRTVQSR